MMICKTVFLSTVADEARYFNDLMNTKYMDSETSDVFGGVREAAGEVLTSGYNLSVAVGAFIIAIAIACATIKISRSPKSREEGKGQLLCALGSIAGICTILSAVEFIGYIVNLSIR